MNSQEICKAVKRAGLSAHATSYAEVGGTAFLLVEKDAWKKLLIIGQPPAFFRGMEIALDSYRGLLCPLTHDNAEAIKGVLPWLKPVSAQGKQASFGTGDRLGLVTGAHIAAFRGTDVFPILAQQSKRELTRTGRTNRSMMDDVLWQVFEAGYRNGYGADGDHLKDLDDINTAIEDGSTFITLDCSDHIPSRTVLDGQKLDALEQEYCRRNFSIGGIRLHMTRKMLERILTAYHDAVGYICEVYEKAISACKHHISFEISLDETSIPTSLEAHFFVANELKKRGVLIDSLAPKFCGDFQKGIDYIGDIATFQKNLRGHVHIAEYFGYKISIHSGSDKFRILPYVGQECHGRYHLKTSGTSWVEAVRVIAMCSPALFQEMVEYSCRQFKTAKMYYHVSAKIENIPDVSTIKRENLPGLMDQPDTRQVMHITYGELLTARTEQGEPRFKNAIYQVLRENKVLLDSVITAHIEKHLQNIGAVDAEKFLKH